jgi:hypothetical protein
LHENNNEIAPHHHSPLLGFGKQIISPPNPLYQPLSTLKPRILQSVAFLYSRAAQPFTVAALITRQVSKMKILTLLRNAAIIAMILGTVHLSIILFDNPGPHLYMIINTFF